MRFFLGLGSNLGDRRANLAGARNALQDRGIAVVRESSIYETDPVGGPEGQPAYLNQVIEIDTSFDARALLGIVSSIETSLGRARARETRWGPRIIDIDILLGAELVSDEDLFVPHKRLAERAFVLVPLGEIAPEATVNGVEVLRLLERVDTTGVHRLE